LVEQSFASMEEKWAIFMEEDLLTFLFR
jgi:hypothetical protein